MNKNKLKIQKRSFENLWFISVSENNANGYLHKDGKVHMSTASENDLGKSTNCWAGYWGTEHEAIAFLADCPEDIVVESMTKDVDYWPEPADDFGYDD